MIAGYSLRMVVKDFIRVTLDDRGLGDVMLRPDTDYSWILYTADSDVGKAFFTQDGIIIECKC